MGFMYKKRTALALLASVAIAAPASLSAQEEEKPLLTVYGTPPADLTETALSYFCHLAISG